MTTKSRKYIVLTFLTILSSLFLILVANNQKDAAAQIAATPTTDPMQEKREGLMEAQEADIGPLKTLTPLSAVPCVGGLAGPYPCNKVDLMAFLPLSDIGGGSGNDIWGWTDPMDGKEYALMGRSSGTSFIDISDPENPIYLGNLPTHSANSLWRDIKVYNNYAFVVSEASSHGMQVFDLTELRSVVNPPVTFAETAHYNGFDSAHNVAINENSGYAYAVGTFTCSGGLHMIDISSPLSPTFAGCYSDDGYTHDAQCVIYNGPDIEHQGKEICFNSNEDTLTIVDVTNKSVPVLLSISTYPGASYTHQGWLTEDHANFLLGDELDETNYGHNTRTYLWDLIDLDAPALIGNYTATTPAIDHNMYVKGKYVYQSNYRAGLRILDVSGIGGGTLVEKGYFDVYPANDNPSFDGTWSNYPYFNSGNVVISGIDEGLFVVQPAPDFELLATPDAVGICVPDEADYNIDVLQFEGFNDPVTLSAIGNPGSTTVSFSVNPVVPPGASTMTVGNTAGASPGSYNIDVIGVAPTSTHTITVGLGVYTVAPGQVTLVDPPDGSTGVDLLPTLVWTGANQAGSYEVEIASDGGFADIVYSATVSTTSHQISVALDPESTYYWHVRALNPCGLGNFSSTFSFTTSTVPPVLLVDDDDNNPDVRSYFTNALGSLGYDYDVFEVGTGEEDGPDLTEMQGYSMVIWFSGDKYSNNGFGSAGPNATDEANLSAYLDGGGRLFLSSQDYLWDFDLTPFGQSYLGIGSYANDFGNDNIMYGIAGDPIGDGLGPYPLSYPSTFEDFPDIVNAGAGASDAFYNSFNENLNIDKDGGDWRTVFFGTSWAAVANADPANGEELLGRIINWFEILPNASITLNKTVGTDAGLCAETDSLVVPSGTQVTYCYMVTNTGDVTLPLHDLEDSELGTLLEGTAYELEPGMSFPYLTTTVILTDTSNSATWTAYVDNQITAEATDSATVSVVNPSIELDVTVGLDDTICAQNDSITLPAGGEVTFCYTVSNTGDVTLPLHDLEDSELGQLLSGEAYDLLPGESFSYLTSTVILTDTNSSATWTAYVDEHIVAEASDGAVVTILYPGIEFAMTVGTGVDICALTDSIAVTSGTEVTYCYTVTNTGEITLAQHDLVDSELGQLLSGEAYDLLPGESFSYLTSTVILTDTNSSATWTAYTEVGGVVATASDDTAVAVAGDRIYLPLIRRQ